MCQHVISMVISDVCESGANYKLRTRPAFQFISSDRGNCATCLIYSISSHRLCFGRIMTIQFGGIELRLISDFCVCICQGITKIRSFLQGVLFVSVQIVPRKILRDEMCTYINKLNHTDWKWKQNIFFDRKSMPLSFSNIVY